MIRYLFKLALVLCTASVFAHGGEDHGAAQQQQAAGKSYFTLNGSSNLYELVLRYEPLKANQKAVMVLFVSEFETNKPVNNAKIDITTIEGDLKFTTKQVDVGKYHVEGMFPANKEYTLAANVSAGGKADLLTLDHVDVGRELPVEAEHEHEEEESFNWKTAIFIGGAFAAGLLIAFLFFRRKRVNRGTLSILLVLVNMLVPLQPYQQAFAHGGEDHSHGAAKPSAGGKTDELEVPKETQFLFDIETTLAKQSHFNNVLKLYGRVISTPEGEALIMAPQPSTIVTINVGVGDKVGKGQILAVVEQALGAAEQVQLEAERSANLGELEQAKKDYERLKSLEGIVARKEIVAAEIRYQTALQNQKVYSSISSGSGRTITIKSPIDGVVSNFNLSKGQVLDQGQQLFSIIDNSKLKIDAQVFGEDIKKISDDMRFTLDPVNGNASVDAKLVAFGKVVDPVTQAAQLVLETENAALMPGQYVTVNVIAKSEQQKLVVPSSAISDINGKPVVYVHTSPEIFTVRFIQAGESSNESAVVLKGLKEGERVVVNGAYQVKSIFLNQ